MYILVLLSAFLTSLAVGFYSGTNAEVAEERQLMEKLVEKNNDAAPARSLTFAISVIAQEGNRADGLPVTGKPTLADAIDKVERTPKENELYRLLGTDAWGMQFRRSLIAQKHQEVPGVDLYVDNFISDLSRDPGAVEGAKTALDRIPAGQYPLERVAILAALARGDGNADAVKSLARQEFTQSPPEARPDPSAATTDDELNVALSTSPAQARPIAAHGLFLKNTQDPTEALGATVDGIVAQTDWGIRSTMAIHFLETYPNMNDQLKSALSARGITLQFGHDGE
jgi:hypothetical protein